MKKFIFVSVSMILLALTSCENENWTEWTSMSFVCEETTIDESGNLSVPASGGTYHIKCTNYRLIYLNYDSLWENGKPCFVLHAKYPIREIKGKWAEVTMQDDVLTVSIKPNKSGEKRKSELIVHSAGAKGGVIFSQAAG